jgi:hypothetical protein
MVIVCREETLDKKYNLGLLLCRIFLHTYKNINVDRLSTSNLNFKQREEFDLH